MDGYLGVCKRASCGSHRLRIPDFLSAKCQTLPGQRVPRRVPLGGWYFKLRFQGEQLPLGRELAASEDVLRGRDAQRRVTTH